MGENLTFRVRLELLHALFHKQICWYDREERAPGIITSYTSKNVIELNGMTTELVATLVEMILMMVVCIGVGAIICWQQFLIILALSPIIVGGTVMMMRMNWTKQMRGASGLKEKKEG